MRQAQRRQKRFDERFCAMLGDQRRHSFAQRLQEGIRRLLAACQAGVALPDFSDRHLQRIVHPGAECAKQHIRHQIANQSVDGVHCLVVWQVLERKEHGEGEKKGGGAVVHRVDHGQHLPEQRAVPGVFIALGAHFFVRLKHPAPPGMYRSPHAGKGIVSVDDVIKRIGAGVAPGIIV